MLSIHEHSHSHQDRYPLSYAQQRLWLLDRLEPGSPAYNIARAIRMRGTLSIAALQKSLQTIVARHQSLRTTFTEIDGEPVQCIAPSGSLDLPIVDLSDMPPANRDSKVRQLIRDEAQQPFDLARGPLSRTTLLRLSADECILVLVMHHIITDAWSMSILFEELGKLYQAFVAGSQSPLPTLSLQYGDYAHWQREALKETIDEQVVYWQRQLAGAEPLLELPADRSHPATRTARGAIQKRVFSGTLRDRLRAVGREANATLFMTLLAAFQTLLWRYTGREDLLIGSPTAGREEIELEHLIGFFVNTLVLRTDLSGNPTFRELLGRVRDVTLAAYDHQKAPFEKIVEVLHLQRNLSYTPLFQVMFILQNAPKQHLELVGLTLEELEFDYGTAKFDLTVDMAEEDDGLSCIFEYSTDLFEPATITRMLDHLQTLLEGIVADPGQHLSALPLMRAAEQQQLLVAWNNTAATYPHEASIHGLFTAQATRTPEDIALVCRDQRITYAELDARANQLAHYLCDHGVKRGVLVGICLERSIEAVVGLLGILKAGGAYVAMDPAYPSQRLAFMLTDSQAPVLLTTQTLLQRMPNYDGTTICLDEDWGDISLASTTSPQSDVQADDLAYVMYTSGSTGTPKGVMASHRASVNRFSWMWRQWPFTPGEVCCQKTALSFVDSVWEIFGPLLQGVQNVIIPDEVLDDLTRLSEVLATHRVSRIVLVPSLLRFLLDDVPDVRNKMPSLKLWVSSGEALTSDLAQRFTERLRDATLLNLYGSSEVAADVTHYTIPHNQSLDRIPIGRPIANTQIYVLDPNLNPTPIGVPGEIYVGGHGLAKGYLNNPELTAQKFIANPFSTGREDRLYKTGDRGRFRLDGTLEFLGRVDNQVKIRGIRIELGEIESVLKSHPSVQDVIVVVNGEKGAERLIAYVVQSNPMLEANMLREFVKTRLPYYMMPASFLVLDSLPLLPNGKVDRQALPAIGLTHRETERQYLAPRNPAEQKLAEIMCEVLKIERIGMGDNFFEMGGHSLLGMQVIARVRKVFQVELPLRRLFEEPTIAGLCLEIEKAEKQGARPVAPVPIKGRSPSRRAQLLAKLEQLSDEEVEALLGASQDKEPNDRDEEEF